MLGQSMQDPNLLFRSYIFLHKQDSEKRSMLTLLLQFTSLLFFKNVYNI